MNYDKLTKKQLLGIHKDTLEYLNEQEQEKERLKEKNEELRALYESEREVKEDYKSRNNKAIEYIETKWKEDSYYEDIDNCLKFVELNEFDKNDLLKILKGVDKE